MNDDVPPVSQPGRASASSEAPEVAPSDLFGMALALAEAEKAARAGDVPVGCLIVGPESEILARGHNQREILGDPTAHAEIVALRAASRVVGHWRLLDTTVYVTLEPCAMCAGALVNARVGRVVWGADDPKWGAMRSQYAIGLDGKLNHSIAITPGVLRDPCVAALRRFFEARRRKHRESPERSKGA